MTTDLLAISIGNTRARLGTFVSGKLERSVAVDKLDVDAIAAAAKQAYEPLRAADDALVLLASVNPEVTAPLMQRLESQLADGARAAVRRMDHDVPIAIGRQLDREAIVGEDRLLNAAAAYQTLKQACVVVDAGTAITVDFIDGAGTFHGGAIGPGFAMMLRSLHEHTAQLPEVSVARPEEAIGHNTAEAMRSAAFHGLRGLVRELVEQYAEVAGAYPMVIATGGDAELLFGDYELVERIVPDLTLLGMAASLQAMLEAGD